MIDGTDENKNDEAHGGSHRPDRLFSLIHLAEETITVAHLVAGHTLHRVKPDEPASRTTATMERLDFDVAPLDEVPITRYVDRSRLQGLEGGTDGAAQPIDPTILVAANLCLAEAIELLREAPTLFVFDRHDVIAVLTSADLQHPTVSLYALGLITASEAALDELIRRYSNGHWQGLLTEARLDNIHEIYASRQSHNSATHLVDCLNLDDRLALVTKLDDLTTALGFRSKKEILKRTKPIKTLRNVLAHGDSLLSAEPDPVKAIDLLRQVRTFAEDAWELVHDDGSLLDRFIESTLTVTLEDQVVALTGPGVDDVWPFAADTAWVITAWNPMGRPHPSSRNERANEAMHAELIEAGHVPFPATGGVGRWSEPGFVILDTDQGVVLDLARSYGQKAVFRVSSDLVQVVWTNGQVEPGRPRRKEARL